MYFIQLLLSPYVQMLPSAPCSCTTQVLDFGCLCLTCKPDKFSGLAPPYIKAVPVIRSTMQLPSSGRKRRSTPPSNEFTLTMLTAVYAVKWNEARSFLTS